MKLNTTYHCKNSGKSDNFMKFVERGQVAQRALYREIPETAWQAQVEELLTLLGWRYYHTWNSRNSQKGFPDVIALRGQRRLVAELKREGGNPTAAQQAWLDDFANIGGFEVYVWRPGNIDEVIRVLR